MKKRSQRFGVRNSGGARSFEWIVIWSTDESDVYLLTRTPGGMMKASLQGTGQCHVRAPDPLYWRSAGEAPGFLDDWSISPASKYEFPFAVVIPEPELCPGEWTEHRDKGTVWIQAPDGQGTEVGIFLVRAEGDLSETLFAAGWNTHIVDAQLPDKRRLLVVARHSRVPVEWIRELAAVKNSARANLNESSISAHHSRMLLFAGPDPQGTRRFVEVAALQ